MLDLNQLELFLLVTTHKCLHTAHKYFIHPSNHTDLMLKIVFADLEAVASQVVTIPNQNELLDAPSMC